MSTSPDPWARLVATVHAILGGGHFRAFCAAYGLDSRDVEQAVYLKVADERPDLLDDPPRSWVWTVCNDVFLAALRAHMRRRRREPAFAAEVIEVCAPWVPSVEDVLIEHALEQERERALRAVFALPKKVGALKAKEGALRGALCVTKRPEKVRRLKGAIRDAGAARAQAEREQAALFGVLRGRTASDLADELGCAVSTVTRARDAGIAELREAVVA